MMTDRDALLAIDSILQDAALAGKKPTIAELNAILAIIRKQLRRKETP
jgi:hypothetical protein